MEHWTCTDASPSPLPHPDDDEIKEQAVADQEPDPNTTNEARRRHHIRAHSNVSTLSDYGKRIHTRIMSHTKEKTLERADFLEARSDVLVSRRDVIPEKRESAEKLRRTTVQPQGQKPPQQKRDVTATTTVAAPLLLGTVTLPKTTPAPTPSSINTAATEHVLSTVTAQLSKQHASDFRRQQIERIINAFLQRHPPKSGENLPEYLKVNIPRYIQQIKRRRAQQKNEELKPTPSVSPSTIPSASASVKESSSASTATTAPALPPPSPTVSTPSLPPPKVTTNPPVRLPPPVTSISRPPPPFRRAAARANVRPPPLPPRVVCRSTGIPLPRPVFRPPLPASFPPPQRLPRPARFRFQPRGLCRAGVVKHLQQTSTKKPVVVASTSDEESDEDVVQID